MIQKATFSINEQRVSIEAAEQDIAKSETRIQSMQVSLAHRFVCVEHN